MFARAFTVFNVAQVDGYEPEPIAMLPENERFVHADAFVEALKIPVVVGAYDAHYRIDLDHWLAIDERFQGFSGYNQHKKST
jgi:antirestriction protein ArdC